MGIFNKPVVVKWSASNPKQTTSGQAVPGQGPISKRLSHEGISLFVTAPEFDASHAELDFSVSSVHEKSVGLGVAGVALDVEGRLHVCTSLAASKPVHSSRMRWDEPIRDVGRGTVMVSEFETSLFEAQFRPTPGLDRAKVVIEMKRLFAPNFIFVVPFDCEALEGGSEEQVTLSPELRERLRMVALHAAQMIEDAVHLGFGIGYIQLMDLRPIPEKVIEELAGQHLHEAERNSKELAGAALRASQLLQQTRALHMKHGNSLSDCKDEKCAEMKSALDQVRSELFEGAGT